MGFKSRHPDQEKADKGAYSVQLCGLLQRTEYVFLLRLTVIVGI